MADAFVALVDFWSEETRSQYVAGYRYAVRSPGLRALAVTWVNEGRARWDDATGARITSSGEVR